MVYYSLKVTCLDKYMYIIVFQQSDIKKNFIKTLQGFGVSPFAEHTWPCNLPIIIKLASEVLPPHITSIGFPLHQVSALCFIFQHVVYITSVGLPLHQVSVLCFQQVSASTISASCLQLPPVISHQTAGPHRKTKMLCLFLYLF